ncbi:Chloroperoxidase [Boletus reticuloceps]|uniref:Chloroperoxidase n=1 Tax=Boletus reticuloceps TaxID=495285 RepID=A0A8I2YNP9_9AGAM|nr:Chloroperoxidase [Boletus reticuloceps]
MSCPVSPVLASPVNPHDHHSHSGGVCPVTGNAHAFCPPQPGDIRSPCPALNTLANHGFLPRNGKKIGVFDIIKALKEGYNLSTVLAYLLSFGGVLLLAQYRDMSLADLARHNLIEHDASLFHLDAHSEDEYAPISANDSLIKATLEQGGRYRSGHMTLEDVANIRVKREAESRPLDGVHAEVARGEMAIAIGILGGQNAATEGLDMDVLRLWVEQERLPDGWKPDHTQGLYKTYRMATVIRERMKAMKKGEMRDLLDDDTGSEAAESAKTK